ncbi:MAG TPA: GlsB/YeaQ/YmgE family stress response membrane protein [Rhizomicrobium sp.]
MNIPVETLLIWAVVGAVAGFLAGVIVKGGGFGLIGDIVVGILGAFVGGWLLPRLGVHLGGMSAIAATIVSATIGAVVLLLVLRLVRRA